MKEIFDIIEHSNINYVVKDDGYDIIIGDTVLVYNSNTKNISILIRYLRNLFNDSSQKERKNLKDHLEKKFNITIQRISHKSF